MSTNIFDLLEAITEGAPEGSEAWLLKGGYSRNTGGVEMDYIVPKLRAALSTTPKHSQTEQQDRLRASVQSPSAQAQSEAEPDEQDQASRNPDRQGRESGQGGRRAEILASGGECSKRDVRSEGGNYAISEGGGRDAAPKQPEPSKLAGDVVETSDVELRKHFQRMMDAATNYIEPAVYIARHPQGERCPHNTHFPEPDAHDSSTNAENKKRRRDRAFINDMLYMLDGPEQRAALAKLDGGA